MVFLLFQKTFFIEYGLKFLFLVISFLFLHKYALIQEGFYE